MQPSQLARGLFITVLIINKKHKISFYLLYINQRPLDFLLQIIIRAFIRTFGKLKIPKLRFKRCLLLDIKVMSYIIFDYPCN